MSNSVLKLPTLVALATMLFGSIAVTSTAQVGYWFLHKFGELRAYYQHFLNVCTDAADGLCWTVQYRLPSGSNPFVGDAKFDGCAPCKGRWERWITAMSLRIFILPMHS